MDLIKTLSNEILSIEKAGFGLPKLPSIKFPTGMPSTRQHKYVKKEENYFGPGKHRYWYKMPDGSLVSSDEEKKETKEKQLVEEQATEKQPATEKLKDVQDQTKDVAQKVSEKIKELSQKKEKIQPRQSRAEKQEIYDDLDLVSGAIDYLYGLKRKVDSMGVGQEQKKQIINTAISAMAQDLKRQLGDRFKYKIPGERKQGQASSQLTREQTIDKVRNYDDKMARGETLEPAENKEYNGLRREIESAENNKINAMNEQNEKQMAAEMSRKSKEFEDKLSKGQPPYEKRQMEFAIQPVKLSNEQKDEDVNTFIKIRYSDSTGKPYDLDKVKTNNQKVVDKFLRINKLQLPKNAKINYVNGEISFPFNLATMSSVKKQLDANYGKAADEYFTIEEGTPGEKSKLKVKKVGGVDWSIKPIPEKGLAESINEIGIDYSNQAKQGKRIEYKFEYAPGQYLTNPPDSPEGENLVFLQGGQRSGKGLMFGTMMNQALGSANGGVVKFYNFDPTGAFWNDMTKNNPNIVNEMDKKGLMGHNGVTKDDIMKISNPEQQGKAIKGFIDNFVNKYNEIYSERAALKSHYKVGHINQIQDYQIPQAVFNVDELQQLENAVLKNPSLSRGDKKQLLNRVTGIFATQKTNGKKLGITLVGAVQNGFTSDEMNELSGASGNHLISLDGQANIKSFAGSRGTRGFTNAVKKGSRGNAVMLETGKPDQKPMTVSPIIPGNGTAKALAKRGS
jgi:hypothetical protein